MNFRIKIALCLFTLFSVGFSGSDGLDIFEFGKSLPVLKKKCDKKKLEPCSLIGSIMFNDYLYFQNLEFNWPIKKSKITTLVKLQGWYPYDEKAEAKKRKKGEPIFVAYEMSFECEDLEKVKSLYKLEYRELTEKKDGEMFTLVGSNLKKTNQLKIMVIDSKSSGIETCSGKVLITNLKEKNKMLAEVEKVKAAAETRENWLKKNKHKTNYKK